MVEMNNAVPTSAEQNRLAASNDQPGIQDFIFPICIVAHFGFATDPLIQHDATLAVQYNDHVTYPPTHAQCKRKSPDFFYFLGLCCSNC
tara:strand:- start:33005 stop:33271 length:267 start_codon:yes stop_codon:yes gene_type:complete